MTGSSPGSITFFLDANVLISAAWKANAEVAAIWRLAGVRLMTSVYVMAEVQRNLPHVAQIERLRELMALVDVLQLAGTSETGDQPAEVLLLPAKDRPVLIAAIAAQADYLITGDKKHFSQWFGKIVGGVRIEPPTDLLRVFRLESI